MSLCLDEASPIKLAASADDLSDALVVVELSALDHASPNQLRYDIENLVAN